MHYHELPRNVGRAAIRNQLAAAAQHEWLLLLDNDSLLPDPQFLARYAAARTQAAVLIGGTCYAATPPADAALHLRWLYGQAREARPAAVRQAAPYGQLTINNALIRADIFRQFPLDERLTGYGHEDTKFGEQLAAAQVAVLHLDNPVLHAGLEPAAIFLQKSEQAVHNLARVYREDGLGSRFAAAATGAAAAPAGPGPGGAGGAAGCWHPRCDAQLLSATPAPAAVRLAEAVLAAAASWRSARVRPAAAQKNRFPAQGRKPVFYATSQSSGLFLVVVFAVEYVFHGAAYFFAGFGGTLANVFAHFGGAVAYVFAGFLHVGSGVADGLAGAAALVGGFVASLPVGFAGYGIGTLVGADFGFIPGFEGGVFQLLLLNFGQVVGRNVAFHLVVGFVQGTPLGVDVAPVVDVVVLLVASSRSARSFRKWCGRWQP